MDLRFFLIEDNYFHKKNLKDTLRQYFVQPTVHLNLIEITNFVEFYQKIPEYQIQTTDILFIDIDLSATITGIDIAKKLSDLSLHPYIIFITSYEGKAIDVINSGARPFLYIVKGHDREENSRQIKNACQELSQKFIKKTLNTPVLALRYKNNDIYFSYNEICYITTIKGERNKVLLQTLDRQLICSNKFNQLKKELPNSIFLTELKFYILNLSAIKKINRTKNLITFVNDCSLEVGTKIIDKIVKEKQKLIGG